MKSNSRRNLAGFSLVEMAVVMIISGILMIGFMGYYMDYRESEARSHTEESSKILNSSVRQFLLANLRYPCPADPSLIPGDADFGREDCTGASLQVATAGGLDRDADGNDDQILIGSIPFADLFDSRDLVPLTLADTLDGWSNRFTYAVTRNLTNAATYNKEWGAINVIDEYSNSLQLPARRTHYLIVSHGPNGFGAFSRDGGQTEACNVLVIPPGTPPEVVTPATERENCDGDDTFMSGLRRDGEFSKYDDSLKAYVTQDTQLWKMTGQNTAANTNIGNVGIFPVTAPQEKLHIGTNLTANQVIANEVCDTSGTQCMPVDVLTGSRPEMQCPAGQALIRIANNQAYCADYRIARPSNIRCAVGEIMVGYDRAANTLQCEPRP